MDVSPELISKIPDAVPDEVREWQARPLDPMRPVIFLAAIVCKVRGAGTVKNRHGEEQGRPPFRRRRS